MSFYELTNTIEIKIVNDEVITENDIPRYQTDGSVGLDLLAAIETPEVIKPRSRVLIPTGIAININDNVATPINKLFNHFLNTLFFILTTPFLFHFTYLLYHFNKYLSILFLNFFLFFLVNFFLFLIYYNNYSTIKK